MIDNEITETANLAQILLQRRTVLVDSGMGIAWYDDVRRLRALENADG